MNRLPPREPGLVKGARPVNRRTALPQQLPVGNLHPEAELRIQQAQARRALGASLSGRLRATPKGARPVGPLAVCAALGVSSGAALLLLAALGGDAALGLAGAGLVVAGTVCAWRWRRAARVTEVPMMPIFDAPTLQALDQQLERAAPELPPTALAQVRALKEALFRVAHQAGHLGVDEHFTLDDRLYVSACGQRYLPDTLQAYLAVPKAQRTQPLSAGGASAADLLLQQLTLLLGEIESREAALGRSAGAKSIER